MGSVTGLESSPWNRSTARRSGRTGRASRASCTTSATPTRTGSPRSGRWRSSRAARRSSSPPAQARRPRSCSRLLEPGQTIALAEGGYFGTGRALRGARALGRSPRRVRPDRPAARRRRPRLARGALEPVPDDAGPRGGGRRIPARVVVDSTAATPSTCARSSTAPTSRSTARRSTSAATPTCCSARSSAARPTTPRGCATSAAARGSSPRPTRAGCSRAACKTLRAADGAPHRDRARRSPSGCARTLRSRSCAIRASAACSRSTSPTATPRTRSRRRCGTIKNATSLGGVESVLESRAPLGGRPRPAGAAPPERRPRGRRRALGRPRASAGLSTVVFFPEGAFGPTNNCVGIGQRAARARRPGRLRRRGVVRRARSRRRASRRR